MESFSPKLPNGDLSPLSSPGLLHTVEHGEAEGGPEGLPTYDFRNNSSPQRNRDSTRQTMGRNKEVVGGDRLRPCWEIQG